ncbi:MAG TPA: HD domain-containing phosphohydrolase [Methylomirabilota bacterium]|jgi:putative two-component system response regulator|nr:HD domain-containing phosphohydrolase [Methylomirabilota bacterium]
MTQVPRPRVLIVDDDSVVRETIRDSVEHLGYATREAASAEEALQRIAQELPDLILLDVRMPGITGIELCRRLKADQATHLIPIVLLTAQGELDTRVAGLEAGADDYFTKPVHLRELRARLRALIRLKRVVEELEQAENMITTLALTIEARDTYTAGHCVRLANFAVELGERLGLREDELGALRLGGFLHDLGKIQVPDGVLLKPGALTPDEWRLIKEHPAAGDRLATPMRTLGLVRPVIRHHHERMDGQGYPDKLAGQEIPFLARIMAVVDVYDALRTRRPYKPPLDEAESLRLLHEGARTGQLDPEVVRVFVELRTQADRNA